MRDFLECAGLVLGGLIIGLPFILLGFLLLVIINPLAWIVGLGAFLVWRLT